MGSKLTKAVAEMCGTAALVCVVVGSGIMGATVSSDDGVTLVINTASTVLALGLLIAVLAPISGAHLNPVVTCIELAKKSISTTAALVVVSAQIVGAIAGTAVAHVMFGLPPLVAGVNERFTIGTGIGEMIATAGLVIVIGVFSERNRAELIPIGVAAWIGSAYLFTSSTSFANPAVTVGRMFTDTFAGIAPASAVPFIAAQAVGALLGASAVVAIVRASPESQPRSIDRGDTHD